MKRPAYLRVIRFTVEGDPVFYQVINGSTLHIDDSWDRFGSGEGVWATYEHIGTVDLHSNVPSRLFILYNGELPTEDELQNQPELYQVRWMDIASVPLSELGEP